MKMRIIFAFAIIAFWGTGWPALATTEQEDITILHIYFTADGKMAINANVSLVDTVDNTCTNADPTKAWANTWAAIDATASDRMVSGILQAHAMGRELRIRYDGCVGEWQKLVAFYIMPDT